MLEPAAELHMDNKLAAKPVSEVASVPNKVVLLVKDNQEQPMEVLKDHMDSQLREVLKDQSANKDHTVSLPKDHTVNKELMDKQLKEANKVLTDSLLKEPKDHTRDRPEQATDNRPHIRVRQATSQPKVPLALPTAKLA